MYVYNNKYNDYVSASIKGEGSWDSLNSIYILKALEYYSKKTNITNENIYILDMGANVGWFSFYLSKYGYNILSFEASKINDYILRKNYCLNNDSKVIIINKGIYNEEKICDYYITPYNIGNEFILCNGEKNKTENITYIGKTIITKLSNYIPYLSTKNVAFIKIDIEGTEAQAIESGIELITKYHIPFIYLEFSPISIKSYGIDPRSFLKFFEENKYKFLKEGFFKENYLTIDEIMNKTTKHKNLFIVYFPILEKNNLNK